MNPLLPALVAISFLHVATAAFAHDAPPCNCPATAPGADRVISKTVRV